MILNAGHAGSRVERGQLGGVELVLHHKRAILDAPQALPGAAGSPARRVSPAASVRPSSVGAPGGT